jgi:hypothetical protein
LASINGMENVEPGCLNFDGGIAQTMMRKILEKQIQGRFLEQVHEEQWKDIMAWRLDTFNQYFQMTLDGGGAQWFIANKKNFSIYMHAFQTMKFTTTTSVGYGIKLIICPITNHILPIN